MLPSTPSLQVLAASVPSVGVYWVVTAVADDRLNSSLLPRNPRRRWVGRATASGEGNQNGGHAVEKCHCASMMRNLRWAHLSR
jgi:hypothetical protein